jgi:hypothetical protein
MFYIPIHDKRKRIVSVSANGAHSLTELFLANTALTRNVESACRSCSKLPMLVSKPNLNGWITTPRPALCLLHAAHTWRCGKGCGYVKPSKVCHSSNGLIQVKSLTYPSNPATRTSQSPTSSHALVNPMIANLSHTLLPLLLHLSL